MGEQPMGVGSRLPRAPAVTRDGIQIGIAARVVETAPEWRWIWYAACAAAGGSPYSLPTAAMLMLADAYRPGGVIDRARR